MSEQDNLPPVTKLTPEERAKMLQAEFLETEEKYVEHLKFLVEVIPPPPPLKYFFVENFFS